MGGSHTVKQKTSKDNFEGQVSEVWKQKAPLDSGPINPLSNSSPSPQSDQYLSFKASTRMNITSEGKPITSSDSHHVVKKTTAYFGPTMLGTFMTRSNKNKSSDDPQNSDSIPSIAAIPIKFRVRNDSSCYGSNSPDLTLG